MYFVYHSNHCYQNFKLLLTSVMKMIQNNVFNLQLLLSFLTLMGLVNSLVKIGPKILPSSLMRFKPTVVSWGWQCMTITARLWMHDYESKSSTTVYNCKEEQTSLFTVCIAQSKVPLYNGLCPGKTLGIVCSRTLKYKANIVCSWTIKYKTNIDCSRI